MAHRPQELRTWDAFTTKLRELYPPVDPVDAANTKIQTLRQRGGLLDYLSELDSLASVTGLNEATKMILLRQGIKTHLLTKLATLGTTYNTYLTLRQALLNVELEEGKIPNRPSGLRGGGNDTRP